MWLNTILTKEFLIEQIKQGKSRVKIAQEVGCGTESIAKYLKRYKLTTKLSKETHSNFRDLTGQIFGLLTVINRADNDSFGKARWNCKCQCGKEVIINGASLTKGLTKSCGCLKTKYLRGKHYHDISPSFYRRVINNASEKNISFAIKMEDIWNQYEKQNRLCAISGLKISFVPDYNKQTQQTASVDRIDSSRGYYPDNIQIVHKRVNYIKGNMDLEELKFWIYHMSNHLDIKEEPQVIKLKHMLDCNGASYEIEE